MFEMMSTPLFVSQMPKDGQVSGLTTEQHLCLIADGTWQEGQAGVQRSFV